MRLALGIEYDGSGFAGWQWQPGRRTVQAELEAVLGRIANQPVRYSVTRGGGKLIDPVSGAAVDSLVVNTADTGHTEVRFILGPEVGNNLVEVNFDGNPTGSATFVIYGVARRTTPATL